MNEWEPLGNGVPFRPHGHTLGDTAKAGSERMKMDGEGIWMVLFRMEEMGCTWVSRVQETCGGADTKTEGENAIFIACLE